MKLSDIARRVVWQRARRPRIGGALDEILHQPARSFRTLLPRLYPGPAQIIDLAQVRAARQQKRRRPQSPTSRRAVWAAVTAGAAVGALLMGLVARDRLTYYEDGRLIARGRLNSALNAQLTGQSPAGAPILLTATYRTRGGSICRSFSVAASHLLSGLACRERGQWRVHSLSSGAGMTPEPGTARGATPAPLSNAIEMQLRAHGWQP